MRARMVSVLLGAALTVVLATPAAAQEQAPDVDEIFSPWATVGLDPLGDAAAEDVPTVQQPDYFRQPLFKWYFGSGLASGTGRASVALGTLPGGSVRAFVATTNDRVQVFDATNPGASLGSFGSFQDAAGIATYRGKVYVVDRRPTNPELARIEVFELVNGAWTRVRTIPLVNPAGLADMTGIDIVGGEIWVTGAVCGGFAGIVQILDVETGALKGISGHLAHTPTGDPAKPCDEAWDASAWWDISVLPEFEAAIAEYRLLHRNIFAALTLPDPELECPRCYRKLWQDGTDGVWGMRWLLVVDGDSRTSRGTGVTEYGIDPTPIAGEPYLIQRRLWAPKQATSGGIRDIAYQNRETRIDWKGQLTDDKWQRGRRCIDEYDVSDADFYAIGAQGEYWHEQARGFKSIEMWLKPNEPAGSPYQKISFEQTVNGTTSTLTESPHPTGNMCIDTNRYASGKYTLQLRAYVNPDPQTSATKTVTIENPQLGIDHDVPTGELDPVPQYAIGDVRLRGSLSDEDSGPLDGRIRTAPSGGSFSDRCPPAPTPYECTWDTRGHPDGRYLIEAHLRDSVSTDRGAANVSNTPRRTTIVDNNPPALQVSGDGRERADLAPIYDDERPTIAVDARDTGSGVVSIELSLDGVAIDRIEQTCPGGGCSRMHTFQLDPRPHPDGLRELRVTATDAAGHARSEAWTIDLEKIVPEPSSDPYEENSGASAGSRGETAIEPPEAPLPLYDPIQIVIPDEALDPNSPQYDPLKFLDCTTPNERPNFDVYSLGQAFEGLPLVHQMRICQPARPPNPFRANFVSYIYGDCDPWAGLDPSYPREEGASPDAGCAAPIEVQSWPICERNPQRALQGETDPLYVLTAQPDEELVIRDAPAAVYDGGETLEVYAGTTTIAIFGDELDRMKRAAAALVREQLPPGDIREAVDAGAVITRTSSADPLPEPMPGGLDNSASCATTAANMEGS